MATFTSGPAPEMTPRKERLFNILRSFYRMEVSIEDAVDRIEDIIQENEKIKGSSA